MSADTTPPQMIDLEAAWAALAEIDPLDSIESVPIAQAAGRILAADVAATISQPAAATAAMDGYAVKLGEATADAGMSYRVIGEAPAGAPFDGEIADASSAVRLFTGSIVPKGADHVIIQEDVTREGDVITLTEAQTAPANIRAAGGDFAAGDVLAYASELITPARQALLAAANCAELTVRPRLKVAIFANGDEVRMPGETLAAGQVINSAPYGISSLLTRWGCDAKFLGIAGDTEDAVAEMFDRARDVDIVVPIGGASVGDYDFVKKVGRDRFDLTFEKVAMKPGKPVWFGSKDGQHVLGLPGNPASALACTYLLLSVLIRARQGRSPAKPAFVMAKAATEFRPNGSRENFLRATVRINREGELWVHPQPAQDSSLLTPFAAANALVRRPANAEEAAPRTHLPVLLFEDPSHGMVSEDKDQSD